MSMIKTIEDDDVIPDYEVSDSDISDAEGGKKSSKTASRKSAKKAASGDAKNEVRTGFCLAFSHFPSSFQSVFPVYRAVPGSGTQSSPLIWTRILSLHHGILPLPRKP